MKKLSDGEIEIQIQKIQGWIYLDNYIEKKFAFKSHSAAFSFVSRIALLAEKMDHHPNWSGVNNEVTIQLSTHEADGVTKNDLDFANEVERILNDQQI